MKQIKLGVTFTVSGRTRTDKVTVNGSETVATLRDAAIQALADQRGILTTRLEVTRFFGGLS